MAVVNLVIMKMHAFPSVHLPTSTTDAVFSKRMLKPRDLADQLDVSVGQVWRIAKKQIALGQMIPGQTETKGGQLLWRNCNGLKAFIERRLAEKAISASKHHSIVAQRAHLRMQEVIAFKRWVTGATKRVPELKPAELRALQNDLLPAVGLYFQIYDRLHPKAQAPRGRNTVTPPPASEV